MQDSTPTFHFTCTLEQALELVRRHDSFWVSNCGCREKRKVCTRSRLALCLYFRDMEPSGTGMHPATRDEVDGILGEAKERHLVARPFRNEDDHSIIDGICFCCDDCCCYFLDPEKYRSDKGTMIECTDDDECVACGGCEAVCYYGARVVETDVVVHRDRCHGCGLCIDICPSGCITMVPRRS